MKTQNLKNQMILLCLHYITFFFFAAKFFQSKNRRRYGGFGIT